MPIINWMWEQFYKQCSRIPNWCLFIIGDNGEKNAIIYEVQKRLVSLGDSIKIDGVYRIETLNAIKNFETKNNLLADGYLDVLTIDLLFK